MRRIHAMTKKNQIVVTQKLTQTNRHTTDKEINYSLDAEVEGVTGAEGAVSLFAGADEVLALLPELPEFDELFESVL